MSDQAILDTSKLDPNQVAAASDATPVKEKASCPLSADTLQLIPIRYALVENLKTNIKTDEVKSHPIGYRFIRDGWLYLVDSKDGRLYELKLKDGVIIERTFKGRWLSADVRGEYDKIPQRDNKELALVFKKDRVLYISFSEIQWTNKQCNQMAYKKECEFFMQKVDLIGVDCAHQNEHLLTREKAEQWIAEVAEKPTQPVPEHTFKDEIKPYTWEDKTQSEFNQAGIGKLLAQVKPECQKGNYLFVAVNDHIGMMQDLANEQEKITEWMGDWSEQKYTSATNYQKYNIATYIESTLEITEENALTKGASKWMMGLSVNQRQTIFDYVTAKIKVEYNSGIGWIPDVNATEAEKQAAGDSVPTVRAPWYLELVADMGQKKQAMIAAITQAEYDKHKDEIETLKDTHMSYLYGSLWGNRGLYDLVHIKELKDYIKTERARLKRWRARLDNITHDRFHLYTTYFHKATWYFDNSEKEQFKQALALECNCTGDLLRTDKVIADMAEFLNKHTEYLFPAFQTNFTSSNFTGLISTIRGLMNSAQEYKQATQENTTLEQKTANMINKEYWLNFMDDDLSIITLKKAQQANLNPAITHGLQEIIDKLTKEQLTPEQQVNVANNLDRVTQIMMRLKPSQRAAYLIALKQQNMAFKTSDPKAINQALTYIENIGSLAEQINSLMKQINKLQRQIKTINKMKIRYSPDWKAQRTNHQLAINKLEGQIAGLNQQIASNEENLQRYTSPLREGETPFALTGNDLTSNQKSLIALEEGMLKKGVLRGYGVPDSSSALIKSIWLPSLIWYLQFNNLIDTWQNYNNKTKNTGGTHLAASLLGTASASLSLAQAAYIGVTQHAINNLKTATNNSSLVKQLETKLGRFSLLTGFFAQGFGLGASALNIYNNHAQWVESLYYGDTKERLTALGAYGVNVGSFGIAGIGTGKGLKEGYGLIRDIRHIRQGFGVTRAATLSADAQKLYQGAKGAVWAARGISFTSLLVKLVPVTIALTVVQVAAEFAYNYYNLSDTQKWFLKCCWGKEDKSWDLTQHNQQLAEVLMIPWLEDYGVLEENGQYWRVIRLMIPGQDLTTLKERPLIWAAHWQSAYEAPDKVDYALYLKQNSTLLQAAAPMVIEWRLPWVAKKDWGNSLKGSLTFNLFHRNDMNPNNMMNNNQVGLEYKVAISDWDIERDTDKETGKPSTDPAIIQADKHPKLTRQLGSYVMYTGELNYGE
ncbi:hypothetical protein MTZ49_07285 [Entomomonas sp. E2T0]|uniref:toxin VasX n=1 Tax=Entomomonas sp. E2T0 TaxID=2930213 RepID=UPI0022283B4F|nr:toxin VasX [Entomomonas sp. E2T0]UYZ85342.1 hypothetical protein MTZ49_07285 [Entomomonas sp. E2T0]